MIYRYICKTILLLSLLLVLSLLLLLLFLLLLLLLILLLLYIYVDLTISLVFLLSVLTWIINQWDMWFTRFKFLWIQPHLFRKYDWGVMTRGFSRTFSENIWIHRVYIYTHIYVVLTWFKFKSCFFLKTHCSYMFYMFYLYLHIIYIYVYIVLANYWCIDLVSQVLAL
jgi:hypothetical protein